MNNELSLEEIKRMVSQERQQRAQTCKEKLDKLLKEHRCRLDWIESWRNGQLIEAGWHIVPLE